MDTSENSTESVEDQIQSLKIEIHRNPFHYDSHVTLVQLLRDAGPAKWEELRHARERMRVSFPLSEDLWMDWLSDEIKHAASDSRSHDRLVQLFESATRDYIAPKIWLKYVSYLIEQLHLDQGIPDQEALQSVRSAFESAITACGLHVTEGKRLWDGYLGFEKFILEALEESDETEIEACDEQATRVDSLYKRLLSVPLLGIDDQIMAEYRSWIEENLDAAEEAGESLFASASKAANAVDKFVVLSFQKAQKKLSEILPFEQQILASAPPHLNEYYSYIQHEKEKGDPARVQNLYERAIKENCLVSDLWLSYIDYVQRQIKAPAITADIHARALRNCPWVGAIWQSQLLMHERNSAPPSTLSECFETALQAGLTTPAEYLELWREYLGVLCRHVGRDAWESFPLLEADKSKSAEGAADDEQEDAEPSLAESAEAMQTSNGESSTAPVYSHRGGWVTSSSASSSSAVSNPAGPGARPDPFAAYPAAVATLLQTCTRAINYMHQYFGDAGDPYGALSQYLANIYLHRCKAPQKAHFVWSKMMKKATCAGSADMWVSYASFERSLPHSDAERVRQIFRHASGLHGLDAPERLTAAWLSFEKEESGSIAEYDAAREKCDAVLEKYNVKLLRQQHRQAEEQERLSKAGRGLQQSASSKRTKRRADDGEENEDGNGDDRNGATQALHSARLKRQRQEVEVAEYHEHDESKDSVSVFVSNLDYEVSEDDLRKQFAAVGRVVDVRLVRKPNGKVRGYAFVELDSQDAVKRALKMDRTMVKNRPMYVSPCVAKKSGSETDRDAGSHYAKNGPDPKTLFVTNVSIHTKREDIVEVFEKLGKIIDVRMVRHLDGRPTGRCYVEFADEENAQKGLAANGAIVKGKALLVRISDPSAGKKRVGGGPGEAVGQPATGKPSTSTASVFGLVPRALRTTGAQPARRLTVPSAKELTATESSSSASATDTSQSTDKLDEQQPSAKLSNAAFRDMFLKKK